jgi:hypothetical protein
MITAETIDKIAERVGAFEEDQTSEKLEEMGAKQPAVFAYILNENETYLFSQEEKAILYYMIIVIWEAVNEELDMPQRLGMKVIDEIQFDNWREIEDLKHPQNQPLDDFFEPFIGTHPEAELLYFVCDGLEEIEETEKIIAKDGFFPLYVMLKTVVDALTIHRD